jgi:hypothetical protein
MTKTISAQVFYCFIHGRSCVHVPAQGGGWVCLEAALYLNDHTREKGQQLSLVPPSLDTAFTSAR